MGYRGEGYTSSGYDDRGGRYQQDYDDGYGDGFDDPYASSGYEAGPYEPGRYGPGEPRDDDRYPGGGRQRGGSGGYPAASDSGSFARPSYVSGGYPTLAHPSGGYATQPGDLPEVPDPYADGNDWYGGPGGHRDTFDTSALPALREEPPSGYVERNPTRYDQPALGDDYGPGAGGDDHFGARAPRARRAGREFGQALQGDDFDGGAAGDYDDYAPRGRSQREPSRWDDEGPQREPSRWDDEPRPAPKRAPAFDDQPPKKRRRRGRAALLSLLVLVLVAAGGAAGFKILHKASPANASVAGTNQSLPTIAPTAATAQCVKQYGQFCHIQLRTLDPAPLTVDEAYPPAFFSKASNAGATRVADKSDTDCSKAVVGNADFLSKLKSGGCSQALRASYLSSNSKIMATIGVLNLSSTNTAHYAGRVIGGTNLVLPLPAAKGVAAKLGQGKGLVMAEYKGHYLIVVWAQFANLAAPDTTALSQQLQQFENTVIAGTANIILSQRMINGDTLQTAPSAAASPSATAKASASASAKASA